MLGAAGDVRLSALWRRRKDDDDDNMIDDDVVFCEINHEDGEMSRRSYRHQWEVSREV